MPLIILKNHGIVSGFDKRVTRKVININHDIYIVKSIQANHYSKKLYSRSIAGVLGLMNYPAAPMIGIFTSLRQTLGYQGFRIQDTRLARMKRLQRSHAD